MAVDKARLFDDALRAIGQVLDWHQGEQLQHAWRVAWLAHALARQLGEPDPTLHLYAGLLHDVGAVGRDEHIVLAARRGFPDAEDRGHPAAGVRILAPFRVLGPVLPLIADHHERLDGGGFPAGKRAGEIAPGAFLVGLADAIELACRAAGPGSAALAVRRLLREEGGRAWPAAVAAAGEALLDANPTLLDELMDPAAVQAAVVAAGDARRWVEGVEQLELMGQLLWLLSRLVEARHPGMLGHAIRVTAAALRIARALGEAGPTTWDVVFAGLLHDVGLVALPRDELVRAGTPDLERLGELRRHAKETHAILAGIRDLSHLAVAAAAHHEHYDGSGFPFGLSGEDIPLLGRILAFADGYDVLTAGSPGRPGLHPAAAIDELRQAAGTRYDPHLAGAALEALATDETDFEAEGDLGWLLRLLELDAPDVRGTLRRVHRAEAVRPAPSDAAPPAWRVVEFDGDGLPQRGLEALQAVAGAREGIRLWDLVDADLPRRLAPAAGRDEDPTASVPLVSARGHPVEAFLRRLPCGWELTFRDVGVQARALERTALFYRNFLAGPEAALFVDTEGRVVDASAAFLAAYQFERDALLGRTPAIFGPRAGGGPSFAEMMARAHDAGGGWTGEVTTFRSDGAPIPALVTATLARDATGAPVGYAVRLVDVSARIRLERDLEAKNAALEAINRTKSELLAVAAHDLRAPVAGMMSHARLLRGATDAQAAPAAAQRLDLIIRIGQGGLELLDRMLALQRIEAGTFRLQVVPIRLDEILAGCVDGFAPVAQERGVELTLEVRGPIRLSTGDPTRLTQVHNNLVSNAVRYAPPGTRVEVICADEGGLLRTEVCDRGPGIPAGERERVFERYYQVGGGRGSGLGLGLHVTRTVVALHGGRVWVEERDGGGCRFVVELPADRPALTAGVPMALLLDPVGTLASQLAPPLEAAGVRVFEVRDWIEAARLGGASAPDLLVAPWSLPDLVRHAEAAAPGARLVRVRGPDDPRGGSLDAIQQDGPGRAEALVLDLPVLALEAAALAQEARRRHQAKTRPPAGGEEDDHGVSRDRAGR